MGSVKYVHGNTFPLLFTHAKNQFFIGRKCTWPYLDRYDDFYFLTDPENFINSHCPDEPEWQLLDEPIRLEEFEKRVMKTSEFYRLGLTLIYPKHFFLVTGDPHTPLLKISKCIKRLLSPNKCTHHYYLSLFFFSQRTVKLPSPWVSPSHWILRTKPPCEAERTKRNRAHPSGCSQSPQEA